MGIGGGGVKLGCERESKGYFFSTVVVSFVGIGCNVSSIFLLIVLLSIIGLCVFRTFTSYLMSFSCHLEKEKGCNLTVSVQKGVYFLSLSL